MNLEPKLIFDTEHLKAVSDRTCHKEPESEKKRICNMLIKAKVMVY